MNRSAYQSGDKLGVLAALSGDDDFGSEIRSGRGSRRGSGVGGGRCGGSGRSEKDSAARWERRRCTGERGERKMGHYWNVLNKGSGSRLFYS